jgi:hypothetical protein
MLRFVFAWFLASLVFTPARIECAPQHDHASAPLDRMGTVHFDTSCSPEVRDEFDLAGATLHSFGYRKSAQLFTDVLSNDPSCSMAEWGIAMSHYRQLWDPPTKDDLRIGLEAAQEGLSMGPKTQRERDYLGAFRVSIKMLAQKVTASAPNDMRPRWSRCTVGIRRTAKLPSFMPCP